MKILDFIIAEDVRMEIGNKHSLIGIYNNQVTIAAPSNTAWPFPFRLSVFIRIDKEGNQEPLDRMKLDILHNGNLVMPIEGPIGPSSGFPFVIIAVNINPFPLPSPGVLEFNIQLFSKVETVFSGQSPFPIKISVQSFEPLK